MTNHAGRQVDGAIASLDALEKIVDAVGDKTYVRNPSSCFLLLQVVAHILLLQVMFDSGVRSAADIFKALALGAKFVFIGRLWIWGLSIAGEHGEYR